MIRLTPRQRAGGFSGAKLAMRNEATGALVAPDYKPNAWDCAKRLRSCSYVPTEHIRKHGDWHVYATDRGIVAITRHPGGRWEIRPFTPPTKEAT